MNATAPGSPAAGSSETRPRPSPRLRVVLAPLVLVVLPFFALLWVTVDLSLRNTRAAITANLVGQARLIAELVENEIETYTTLARGLAASPALAEGDLDAFRLALRASLQVLPQSVATLFDGDARAVVSSRSLGGPADRPSAIAHLHARARETGETQVSSLFTDAFGNGLIIGAVVPVRAARQPGRTISISILPDRFRRLLEDKFPDTIFLSVMDRQGRLVARVPDHDRFVGEVATAEWRAAVAEHREGLYEGSSLDGQRLIAGYATTRHGWVAGVGYSADQVEAPLRRLRWILLSAGLAAFGLSIALAVWVHRRIGESARRLLGAAAALRANGVPPVVRTGVREYDAVARTLADAGAALRDRTVMLATSEARYRELSDAMPQLVWTADADGRLDHYNRQRDQYFGAGRATVNWIAIIHPDDLEPTRIAWRTALAAGEPFEMEHRLRLADGRWHWHLSRAVPQRDAEGRILRWIGTATDVNTNKRRENEAEYLLREVNHRSKNLLAIAQAMTRQTAFDEAPEEIAETLCARFAALSASQDLLLHGEWRRVSLQELVRAQLAHFAPVFGTRIRLDGPPVFLNATAAQAIGMALHELATNATKYGALAGDAGTVAIQWRLDRDAEEARFHMEWVEADGPAVPPPTHQGFGHFVMVRMVEQTLGGEVTLDYAATGAAWRLDAPAIAALEDDPETDVETPVSTASP